MNAEVKLGYKRTEIGVIPEDWCIKPLAELCSFENGDRGKNYPSPGSFVSSGIPFINAGHISNGNIDLRQMDYITPERFNKLGGGKVRNGDILFCLRGSLGKFGLITSAITCGAIASSLVIVRPKSSSITQEYLSSYFSSELCASMIDIWAGGAAQPNLGAQDLAKFLVAIPQCQSEQKKITSVLADADALISSLDLLIAKKRDIHQATMQQLLTGQRRLPGFSGEWDVKRLGDLCTLGMGRTPSRINDAYWGRGYKWLSIADLKAKVITESSEEITELAAKQIPLIKKGTLLMSFKLSIGRLAFAGCDLFTNEAICSFNELKANAEYLYYALQRVDFSLYGKQAVKGFTLNKASLQLVEVAIPAIEEQTAIATILSDMDAELAALETRRDKAHQLKQGMMQELLTGRIRLV